MIAFLLHVGFAFWIECFLGLFVWIQVVRDAGLPPG